VCVFDDADEEVLAGGEDERISEMKKKREGSEHLK